MCVFVSSYFVLFLYFAFVRVCMCCMCVAIYFVYVCMYYRGSTQYRLAFCVTPVMYMWLKLIIIIIIIIDWLNFGEFIKIRQIRQSFHSPKFPVLRYSF